jgi:hypothetical protein
MSAIHGFWQFYDVLANQIPGKPPMLAKFYGKPYIFGKKSCQTVKHGQTMHFGPKSLGNPCKPSIFPRFFQGFSMKKSGDLPNDLLPSLSVPGGRHGQGSLHLP